MDHHVNYPPSDDVSPSAVVVVDRRYCYPDHAVDLKIVKKGLSVRGGDFTVSDEHGNIVFKVEGVFWSRRAERIVFDVDHNPLLSMRHKILSNHSRWKVYRGRSFDEKDLIFSVKRSSIFQSKSSLDVFMAANEREIESDFKVKEAFSKNSCTIYKGDSSTIIAQMERKYTVKNVLLRKDTFEITVDQNVDHAFITALIIIFYEIQELIQMNSS